MAKLRKLELPPPWSDFEIISSVEFPKDLTDEAKLIDERFTDVHNIFKALGAQLLENAIGRYDAILCNICGILFFPQNPEKKCPLCSLVKWLANQGRIASGESPAELKAGMKEELEPHPLFKDWAED